jgi:hypothetical protein
MNRRSLRALAAAHAAHIDRARAHGGRVLTYAPPCGCPSTETPAPKDRRQTWDSLTTCVHCGALSMKIVTHDSVECRVP